jgi:sugar phosphate isomerase/epimerase
MYSFSTCWNSQRHTDGRAMLAEIRDLGFGYAELSHGTRISLLPGILEAVDAGEMKISSLHNFCPLPMGVNHSAPNLFQFTSEDPRERENAVKQTLKTFEFALRVKAPLVVLHLGSIELKSYTDKLLELLERGGGESPKFRKLCEEADAKREKRKEKHVENMVATMRRLIPEAEKLGLKLGCENRQALEEIPFDSDFPFLFRELNSPVVGYWHDTGHAQIKENLGFIGHHMQLESLQEQLFGFHIHDVQPPGRDHCSPGTGNVNFKALAEFVRPDHIKVFEFGPGLTTEEALAGVAHLKDLWGAE